eukprot:403351429
MKKEENKPNGPMGSMYNVFVGQLRSIDRFGYPVSLTYKNNQTFTSGFGGCMTLLSVVSLIIYFGFMLNDVISRNRYIITESTYLRDLYTDTTEYKFSQKTFDYAVYPVYAGFNPAVTNMHQYFSLKFYTIIQSPKKNYSAGEYPLNITYSDVSYTQCTADRFNGEPARAGVSLVGWLCPNFTDLILQGKSSSVISKKFRFEVTYCETAYLKKMYPDLECKPTTEIDAIIADTFILISYLEQYLDVGEFERSPLKNAIQSAQLPLSDDTRFDWYFLSENYLVLKDSQLASTIGTKNITYTKFRNLLTTNQKRAGRKLFLQQSFLIDDLVKTTQRTTYNLIDALTATGGFASIIMIIFRLLTNRIQKILYFTSIMKKLYLYMDDKFKDQLFRLAMNSNNAQVVQGNSGFQNQQIVSQNYQNLQQPPNIYQSQNKHGPNHQPINNKENASQRDLINKNINKNEYQFVENKAAPLSHGQLVRQKTMEMKSKLQQLRFFNYTFTEYIQSKLLNLFRFCCFRKRQNIKELLYQIGVEKLQKEFDMIRHLKKIRVADSVAELTLSQFQRELIPYFDRNILNGHTNSILKLKSKNSILNTDKELATSLKQIVLDSRKSAIDQRIIDNLVVLQETASEFRSESLRKKRTKIITEENISDDQQKKGSGKVSPRKNHKKRNTKQQSTSKIQKFDQDGNEMTNYIESPKKKNFNDTGKQLLSKSKTKDKTPSSNPLSEDSNLNQPNNLDFYTKMKLEGKSKKSTNEIEYQNSNIQDKTNMGININPKMNGNFIDSSSSPVTSDDQSKSPRNKRDVNLNYNKNKDSHRKHDKL